MELQRLICVEARFDSGVADNVTVLYHVLMDNETDKALIELLLRHDKLMNIMAASFADLAALVHEMVPQCQHEGCDGRGTMKHDEKSTLLCDRHTAEAILDIDDPSSTEEHWVEVANADCIRRTAQYVQIMASLTAEEENVQ